MAMMMTTQAPPTEPPKSRPTASRKVIGHSAHHVAPESRRKRENVRSAPLGPSTKIIDHVRMFYQKKKFVHQIKLKIIFKNITKKFDSFQFINFF